MQEVEHHTYGMQEMGRNIEHFTNARRRPILKSSMMPVDETFWPPSPSQDTLLQSNPRRPPSKQSFIVAVLY